MTAGPERRLDPALRVELCREADVLPLMRFIGTEWRAGHILSRDEALLRWQYAPERLKGLRAPSPTVLLAWMGSELVGMLGLTGFEFNVAGETFPAVWLSHWFVAPSYRRYNAALRLLDATRPLGVEVVATVGANEMASRLIQQLGFEVIPSLPRWVGVFDAGAAAELVCAANPGTGLEDAEGLCRSHVVDLRAATAPEGGFRAVCWSATAAAAWDRFWSERLAPQLVGARRDVAYLQWRYLAHPSLEYHMRFAQRETDGAVEGLTVFRIEPVRDRAIRVLRIVEFLASAAGEASLVRSLLEAARDSGAAMGDFYCSSARAAQALMRAGFARQAADAGGVVFPARLQPLEAGHYRMTTLIRLPQASRGTLPQLVEQGGLYITKSDGDQDRPN